MKAFCVVVGLTVAGFFLCGCPGGSSGGSGGGIVIPTPPAITGGTFSCAPLTLMSGQASTCTATVQGVGNYNPNITLTASAGTLSAATVTSGGTATFTAPTVASSTVVTLTATSVQDATKSLTVQIAVGPLIPAITGIVPDWAYLDGSAGIGGIQINGSGFAAGETQNIATPNLGTPNTPLFGGLVLAQGTASNQVVIGLGIGSAQYSPGWFDFSVTTAQGNASNVRRLAFVGNYNTLAIAPGGELFQHDQAQGLPVTSDNGFVRKFKADATADGSFHPGASVDNSISVDDKSGDVVVDAAVYNASGNLIGGAAADGNSSAFMADAAKSGQNCIARPSGNIISCYIVGETGASLQSATVGVQPWAITMVQPASELDAIVYSRGDSTLWRVSVPDMTIRGSVALTGIAPVPTSGPGLIGGWYLGSGLLGKTVAFLSTVDEQLVFVNVSTMSVTKQVDLKALLGTGNVHPFRVALDEPHGKALVAVADTDAGITRFVSIDSTTGAMTTIAATSTLLSVGFGVSADGTTLYSCQRSACEAWPTAAVQPKTNAQVAHAHADVVTPTYGFSGVGSSAANADSVPDIMFSTSRTEVKPGRAVFLDWSAKNVASCNASGDWIGSRPTKGAETIVSRAEGVYNYVLACDGVTKFVTIVVRENPVLEPPTLEVSLSSAKVRMGEQATITWTTTGASSCSAGDIAADLPASGSGFVASPIPGSFTRTLTCTGPGGIVSRSITLTVGLPSLFGLF